jgi:hypothetical protein
MENHLHGRVLLVYEDGMVRAVVEKYAETLSIEVILVVHLHGKIGAEQARATGQGQEETHSDWGEHRLGSTAPLPQQYKTYTRSGRRLFHERSDFKRGLPTMSNSRNRSW